MRVRMRRWLRLWLCMLVWLRLRLLVCPPA